MVNEIVTPIALWRDFDDTLPLKATVLNQSVLSGVVMDEIYFSGRQTGAGRVRIYAVNFRPQEGTASGAVLILNDVFSGIDKGLAMHFARLGLNVLSVDLRGETFNGQNYTKYPEDVFYANAKNTDNTFYFCKNGAKETCWYEWVAVAKYAVKYLKTTDEKLPITVVGVKHGANVLWQLTMSDPEIKGSVYLFGCGWLAYKGITKNSDIDLKMDEERYKYLAAVDAQAYAQYAQNKTLYITALNSGEFDVDRACDTLLRIPGQETVFTEFCGVADEGLDTDLLITIDEFIKAVNEKGKFTFKKNPQIKIDVEESEFCAEVTATVHGDVKNVVCYYAYNAPIPKVRAWLKKESYEKLENEKTGNIFKFKLPVYGNVNLMHAYVETEYEDGVKLSSKILCVNTDVKSPVPCPAVLYGGGGLNAEFIECVEASYKPDEKAEKYIGFDGSEYREAFIDKGVFETTDTPLNIKGVKISGCSAKTYAVRRLTKKPSDSSVIKFDVYLEAAAELKITLETVSGDYHYTINLLSGKAWQNLNLPAGEFKNDKLTGYEGEDILSLKFTVKGAAVINNVLIL